MQSPSEYKYSKEHTWLRPLGNDEALVGITDFAQTELGEIVYVELPAIGESFKRDEVFGSVEALKTTSDLFMPVSGEILEVNKSLATAPEVINTDPYSEGWMIRIKILDETEQSILLDSDQYDATIQ